MLLLLLLLSAAHAVAEVHEHPGSKQPLPHDQYMRVVSEADSPVQQV
jgi:hypothetical protein